MFVIFKTRVAVMDARVILIEVSYDIWATAWQKQKQNDLCA